MKSFVDRHNEKNPTDLPRGFFFQTDHTFTHELSKTRRGLPADYGIDARGLNARTRTVRGERTPEPPGAESLGLVSVESLSQ